MLNGSITTRVPNWWPRLAAIAVLCWALGTNTYFDSTNTSPSVLWKSASYGSARTEEAVQAGAGLTILSPRDARLYQAVFNAQEQGDWKKADRAVGALSDRRLLGHVLADRYHRREPTGKELQYWLSKYADLPQAGELYGRAIGLIEKGEEINSPASAGLWSGADVYGASVGFRVPDTDRKATDAEVRFAAKVNKSLRQGKPHDAELLLDAEIHKRTVSLREAASTQGVIAAGYFYDGQIAQARRLANLGARQQNPLSLWIAGLTAWKQKEMRAAGNSFALLSAQSTLSSWDRTAAQFWAWRALKRAGEYKNASYWLEQAAQQPHTFYGIMAAHLLGNERGWSWELPQMNETQMVVLAKQNSGARALALLQVGQRDLAESELRHINPQGRRDLQSAMLAVATSQHMPSLALQLGGIATRANGALYDAALYPVPPWEPSQGFKVDRALLFALMRRESQFDPTAVSGRGACGLMQILPATAKLMNDGDDSKFAGGDCTAHLMNPAVNMELGQKYVRHLIDQPLVGDNLLLLLAAYNEGPGKLARDLREDHGARITNTAARKEYEREDPLLFVESLPLRETHDYIQQVLIHYWGYRARLGETEKSLGQLAQGEWPSYVATKREGPPKGMRDAALTPSKPARVELASNVKD